MSLIISVATLIAGLVIGYMAQRSGMCIVSGCRNLLVVKDSYLFKGLVGLMAGALAGFIIFGRAGGDIHEFPLFAFKPLPTSFELALTIIGGIGLGFFSVLGQGCPFRQHVMAGEGKRTAWIYLLGLYTGMLFFYVFVVRLLAILSGG